MAQDLQTQIKTTEPYEAVFINKYDDNELWLSIQMPGASARTVLSFDQAREMMAAIQRVLEAK